MPLIVDSYVKLKQNHQHDFQLIKVLIENTLILHDFPELKEELNENDKLSIWTT